MAMFPFNPKTIFNLKEPVPQGHQKCWGLASITSNPVVVMNQNQCLNEIKAQGRVTTTVKMLTVYSQIENAQWRKVEQMPPVWLCILRCKQFVETLEKTHFWTDPCLEIVPGSNRPGSSNTNWLLPRCGNSNRPAAGSLRGEGALNRGADLGLDGGEDLGDQSLLGHLAAAAAWNGSPEMRVNLYTSLKWMTVEEIDKSEYKWIKVDEIDDQWPMCL